MKIKTGIHIINLVLRLRRKKVDCDPSYLYTHYHIDREESDYLMVKMKERKLIDVVWPNIPNYY